MAPSISENVQATLPTALKNLAPDQFVTKSASLVPLQYGGSLDTYRSFDSTSNIGREYPDVQLTELLLDDAKIKDLAITVSQRGVVFFRNQDITSEQQKVLGQKLGELTGKPASSKLHKHALHNSKRNHAVDQGKLDDEISVINSDIGRTYVHDEGKFSSTKRYASEGWHADISFERVPSDYAILKIHTLPSTGGDTLWASGYEAYDRLSPNFQRLAEGLEATHYQPLFKEISKRNGLELLDEQEERGSPENVDLTFEAKHPVIRTNPVTGWKSLYAAGSQIAHGWINGVTEPESDILKAYFNRLIADNHDLQVRLKWNKNDVAIWDNRSTFHTATWDYDEHRQGNRVVSLGEKPFFDPRSSSRRAALGLKIASH